MSIFNYHKYDWWVNVLAIIFTAIFIEIIIRVKKYLSRIHTMLRDYEFGVDNL